MRQHFSDPTFYARRYRASVGAPEAVRRPARPATGHHVFWMWTWWLACRRRGASRPTAKPSALDRWVAHPAVFFPAMLVGSAVMAAEHGVSRDAPLIDQSFIAVGVLTTWFGLTGAAAYAGRRWPRAEPAQIAAGVVLGSAAVVVGILMFRTAIGALLVQIGVWTLLSLAVARREGSPRRDAE